MPNIDKSEAVQYKVFNLKYKLNFYFNILLFQNLQTARIVKCKMEPQIPFLIVGVGLTVLFYLLYLHLTRNFKYWKNLNIPYRKPKLLFGNVFRVCIFQKGIGEFIDDLYKNTKAKLFGFYVFDQPFLLIRDPDIIKHVLVKDFEYFSDRSVISNGDDDKFASSMLFNLKNPTWRNVRMKVTPTFTSGKIKKMTDLIINASKGLIEYIEEQKIHKNKFDGRDLVMKYTTDVIATCAFGITANSFKNENAEFREASKRVFELNLSRAIQAISCFFAPLIFKMFKMRFIEPNAVNFMNKAFIETLHEREKGGLYRGDLVDILIQIKNSEGSNSEKIDDNLLVSQAIQFFVAGFETTGSTIFYTLYELCKNKTVQEKLREELENALRENKKVTYDLIQDLPYLDMVVSETLRKYPVLPFLDRQCTKTYHIPDTDVILKKDMKIYISLSGLHYDSNYFPDPHKFIPERFSPENKNKIPNNVYMPFGQGLRNCIGARFALVSLKMGLISLLANYEVELCPNSEPVENVAFHAYGFLLAPSTQIYMKFNCKPLFDNELFINY